MQHVQGYLSGILGPMLVFGLGMGLLFVPLTIVAVSGVAPQETGAASSLLNVMQQVGGSLGLSILVTILALAVALVVVRARTPPSSPPRPPRAAGRRCSPEDADDLASVVDVQRPGQRTVWETACGAKKVVCDLG
jgi:hypothetical protein